MEGFLNENKINYVLFHLGLTADISKIRNKFVFLKNTKNISNHTDKIIFLLTDNKIINLKNYV